VVVMKSTVFWDITQSSPLKVSRRFGGTYRLYLQVRISRARYQRESSDKHSNRLAGDFGLCKNREGNGMWTSVPTGSPWDRMKPLESHTTTERTNRRQEQEFRMALKRGSFAALGQGQRKNV
jgi:hypothetical protein